MAIGVLAVLIAARIWVRQRAPATVTGAYASVPMLQPNRLTASAECRSGSGSKAGHWWWFRRRSRTGDTPRGVPGALITILASTATAGAQVGAALMFTLVAFTVVEVPLIGYLTTPAKTLAVVRRLNEWMNERRHIIPCSRSSARAGSYCVATAIGKV